MSARRADLMRACLRGTGGRSAGNVSRGLEAGTAPGRWCGR